MHPAEFLLFPLGVPNEILIYHQMVPPSLRSKIQVLALVQIFMPFKEQFPILSTAHMQSVW